MKKKIVSYLILACSIFGMAMVGSCRDYDDYSDLRATNKIEHQTLKDSIASHRVDIDSIFEILKGMCTFNCDSLGEEVYKLDSTVSKWLLNGMVGDSVNDWIDLDSTFNDSNDVAGVLRYLNNKIKDLKHDLDSIGDTLDARDAILQATDSILNQQIVDLKAYVDSIADSLTTKDSILTAVDQILMDSIDTLSSRIYRVDSILHCYIDTIDSISNIVDRLRKCVDDTIKPKVKQLEERLEVVEARVDSLMDAEKRRITSLYVQGTTNPTFGSFALPIGVRSNILMSYYGDFDAVEFPTKKTAKMVDASTVITDREAALLGLDGIKDNFGGDVIFGDSVGNAGKIYFTVNPNEVVIDSTYHFSFVNSLGDSVKVKLDSIKPSSEKLTFGFNYNTRSGGTSSTGFYEALVTIESVSDDLKPRIDKDALISVAEELKGFRDGISLSSISTNIIKQFDGVLDANALKVNWEDSLGEHSVTSGYDVAVATVTPLGYSTFKRVLPYTNRRLPLNPLDEVLSAINAPSMTLKFDTVKLSGMSIAIPNVTYSMAERHDSVKVTIITSVPVTVSGNVGSTPATLTGSGTVNYTTWLKYDSLYTYMNKEITHLIDSMNVALDNVEAKVDSAVKNIQGQIQREVNKMLNTVQGQLQSNVNKMFSDVKTQIGSNRFVSKINSLANKINKVLDNVDALFDVTLLYADDNGDLHPMSGSSGLASSFTGDGTYRLYPSSFTAEVLTPAYKKYVAVTNVISNATGKDVKADDDADCIAKLTSANVGDMNTVLEGTTKYVDVDLKAGYTYEILYSALDYTGGISNRRFYVRVN